MALRLTKCMTSFKKLQNVKFCSKTTKNQQTLESSSDNSKNDLSKERKYPEEPTTCCMSGCANCVWIEYADELQKYFQDGGERAREEINKRVTDPNMKAFLSHELRMRNIK
ncbi:oxidoreductase-like domain-containing protein 1 [Diabrotica virgifera virgifera]|uniref:Oxidoreductase-like domain-containing protein 1 n=1 Tax=Diabrotica virgifera virgifera TaxID=50390 RepID=A0A6P7G9K7_DIAVI|nr:oxidoreductase-like domain-containing protein 1 [Diabrotica virgifera virgifera]